MVKSPKIKADVLKKLIGYDLPLGLRHAEQRF